MIDPKWPMIACDVLSRRARGDPGESPGRPEPILQRVRLARPTSANDAHPASPSVRSMSAIRLASTSLTPCSPPTARPNA